MNEEYVNKLYKALGGDQKGWDFNGFKNDLSTNPDYNKKIYNHFSDNGKKFDYDSFSLDTGFKKKSGTKTQELPQESTPSSKKSSDSKSQLPTSNWQNNQFVSPVEDQPVEEKSIDPKGLSISKQNKSGDIGVSITKDNKQEQFTDLSITKPFEQPKLGVTGKEKYQIDEGIIYDTKKIRPKEFQENQDEIKSYIKETSPSQDENVLLAEEQIYRDLLDQTSIKSLDPKEQRLLELETKLLKQEWPDLNEYSQVKSEYDNLQSTKFAEIDNKISLLKEARDSRSKANPLYHTVKEDVEEIDRAIAELELQKQPFLQQIQPLADKINQDAQEQGKDPKVLLKELIEGKVHELAKIEKEVRDIESKEYTGVLGTLKSMALGVGLGSFPEMKRKSELENEIKDLSKIVWLNKTPELKEDDPYSVFFKGVANWSDMSGGKFQTTKDRSRAIQTSINELGLSSNITPNVVKELDSKSKDYGLDNPSFYAEVMSDTGSMLLPIGIAGAGVKLGIKGVKALTKVQKASKAVSAATSSINAARVSNIANTTRNAITASEAADIVLAQATLGQRASKFIEPILERSLTYGLAGTISPNKADELNIASGAAAALVSGRIIHLFNKLGFKPSFKKMTNTVGQVLGEYGEENAEDLTNAVNRFSEHENFDLFLKDLDQNFGSWDVNLKRFVASVFMSFGFQAANKFSSQVISNDSINRYNQLSDEQKKQAEEILSSLQGNMALEEVFEMDDKKAQEKISTLENAAENDKAGVDEKIKKKQEDLLNATPEEALKIQEDISNLENYRKTIDPERDKQINSLVDFINLRDQTNKNHSKTDRLRVMDIINTMSANKELMDLYKNNPAELSRLKIKKENLVDELEAIYSKYEGRIDTSETSIDPAELNFDRLSLTSKLNNIGIDIPADASRNSIIAKIKGNPEYLKKLKDYASNNKIDINNPLAVALYYTGNKNLIQGGKTETNIQPQDTQITQPLNTDTNATQESQIEQQEGPTISDQQQYTGPEEGQQETRKGEGSQREATQPEANIGDSNISSQEEAQVDEWNNFIKTGQIKQSKNSLGIEFDYEEVSTAKLEQLVSDITNNQSLDEVKKIIFNLDNKLNPSIRAALAKKVATLMDTKGMDTSEIDDLAKLSLKEGMEGGQRLALMSHKTINDELLALMNFSKSGLKKILSEKIHGGKTLGGVFDNNTQSTQENILDIVNKYANNKEFIDLVTQIVNSKSQEDINNLRDKIKEFEAINKELSDKINSGLDNIIDGVVSKKKSKEKIDASKKKIDELKKKLALTKGQVSMSVIPGVTINPEKINILTEIAIEYIKIGISNLNIIANDLRDIAKKEIDHDLNDAELNEILKFARAGNYNIWQKEQNDAKDKLIKLFEKRKKALEEGISTDESTAISDFTDRLISNISKSDINKENKTKSSDEIIDEFLNNLDKYKQVFDLTKRESDRIGLNKDLTDVFNLKFFDSALQKEFNKVNLKDAVEAFINNQEFITSGNQREFISKELTKSLLKNVDISIEDANLIKEKIAKLYDQKLDEIIKDRLKKDKTPENKYRANYNTWQKEKDLLVKRLSDLVNPDTSKQPSKDSSILKEFSDKLFNNIRLEFSEKDKKNPSKISNTKILSDIISNLDKYAEVLEKTRFDMFGNSVAPYQIQDIFNLKFFNAKLKSAVSEQKIKEVITTHFSNLDKVSGTIYDSLFSKLDISEEAAKSLADKINKEVKAKALELSKKKVESLIKITKRPLSDAKLLTERIIKLFNLGAFDSASFNEAYYDVYGITTLSKTDKENLRKLVLITESTFGKEKDKYIQEFYSYFNRLDNRKKPHIAMFINSLGYGFLLSKTGTIQTATGGGLLTAANWARNRIIQNPKGTVMLLKNLSLLKKLDNLFRMAWDVVMYGPNNSAIQESFPDKPGFFEDLYNNKWREPFQRVLEDPTQLKAYIAVAMLPTAKVIVFMKRLLAAQNEVFSSYIAEVDYFFQAYNDTLDQNKKLKEAYEYNKEMIKTATPTNKKELQDLLDQSKKDYEQSLSQVDFLKKMRSAMKTNPTDLQLAEEQYNKELKLLKERGLEEVIKTRSKNYKKNRITSIIYSMRNQKLLDVAKYSANESQLMRNPEGEIMGRFADILARLRIKDTDGEIKAIIKTLARITTIPFSTVMLNMLQMATELTGAGIIKSYIPTTYVSGNKSRGLDSRVKKSEQQKLDQRWNGIVGGLAIAVLFYIRYTYDDEEKRWKLRNPPKPGEGWGLAGSGHGIGYDNSIKNKAIDRGTFQQQSLYYYKLDDDGKKVRVNYSFKDNPFGFGLSFLAEFEEEITIRNYYRRLTGKEEEWGYKCLENAMLGTMSFATSQTYTKGMNDLVELIVPSDTKNWVDKAAKFAGQKTNIFLNPGFYDQIRDVHNYFTQTPEALKDGYFDYAFEGVPLLESYLSGTSVDIFGVPIVKKYTPTFLPNGMAIDLKQNYDIRRGNEWWDIAWKYDNMVPRQPTNMMVIKFSSESKVLLEDLSDEEYYELDTDFFGAYTVEKRIKFKNNNRTMFERFIAEENIKILEPIKEDLKEMDPRELQKELADAVSAAAKLARERMLEYYKNNRKEFDEEQEK